MLSKRLKNDGKPILVMNELQRDMKKQIENKIARGVYSFGKVSCCVCEGKDFELLSEKDRYGLYLPVVICQNCGLVQVNPRLTQEAYDQFYKIEYQKLNKGRVDIGDWFFQFEYLRGKRIYDYFAKTLGQEIANLFVVEVGCGLGGILQLFREKGNEVYGVDLDPQVVELGRTNYALNIEIGTLDKVVKLGKSPDIVIYAHVLEHILDPVAELMKLKTCMANASLAYIEVPGIMDKGNYQDFDFHRFLQLPHVYYFSLTTLKNILRKAGYDFVCGDEYIHSIFKKASAIGSEGFYYGSDYQSIMSFLRHLEFTRLLPNPHRLKTIFIETAIKALKAVGMYNFARAFYHRLRSYRTQ